VQYPSSVTRGFKAVFSFATALQLRQETGVLIFFVKTRTMLQGAAANRKFAMLAAVKKSK